MSEQAFAGLDSGIRSFGERIKNERNERMARANRTLTFGVAFLDLALGGIFVNDLVLIGAKTGMGKTALSTIVAKENAQRGRRVHYFALEAEKDEIERRTKFSHIVDLAFKSSHPLRSRLNYLDWYQGKFDGEIGMLEKAVEQTLADFYGKTLHTFYRERDFTADDLEKRVLEIQDQTDLIIIDHLHYIDSDDPSENRAYKIIVKKIRDTALLVGKPVIAVAHVRKGDRRVKQLMPSIEDFHGTSDIAKIATKAIMLAPVDGEPIEPHLWDTYIAIGKCRFEGSRTRYVARCTFNAQTNSYEDEFFLGRITNGGEQFDAVPHDRWPTWAKRQQGGQCF